VLSRLLICKDFLKLVQVIMPKGDIFLGVMVPKNRKIAKKYAELSLSEIKKLTDSDYHEVRFCGLLILVSQFEKAKTRALQKKYFDFYLRQLNDGSDK